jgi:beta-aspartyl-peptidase (threonine type)
MNEAQASCLAEALQAGYALLDAGASSLNAVEAAIRVLEASALFNAGVGSRVQLDGVKRMDASIMEGRTLRAGAVGSIERIVHPITAARLVMDETSHVLLVGRPATRFAQHFKLERQSTARAAARRAKRCGLAAAFTAKTLRLYRAMANAGLATRERLGRETVGAVALDRERTVAAGASTGGIDCMLPGRVGDTPLIGCGIYADNRAGAISMTGLGESIIRVAVAKEIADRLADGLAPSAAARVVLKKLVSLIRGAAGALVLSPDGRFAIMHTTPRMAAGWWDGTRKPVVKDRFK